MSEIKIITGSSTSQFAQWSDDPTKELEAAVLRLKALAESAGIWDACVNGLTHNIPGVARIVIYAESPSPAEKGKDE